MFISDQLSLQMVKVKDYIVKLRQQPSCSFLLIAAIVIAGASQAADLSADASQQPPPQKVSFLSSQIYGTE